VNHAADGGEVDETVERRPLATQLPDRPAVGRDGEQEEDDEDGHPDGDERPLEDVGHHGRDVEVVDEDDPGREVERGVEERKQAEHSPQLDQIVPAGELSQRRDTQRREKRPQRPVAGLIGDVVARVRGEVVGVETPDEQAEGNEGGGEERRLQQGDRLRHRPGVAPAP
jgi:hypothetical protein